jgi:trimethylamine:corrinoid methyltransferase-like protein
MNMRELLEMRALVDVAHHVPGRLRLRLDPRVRDHPAASEFGEWSANGSGILATRLNPMARSLVVEYDPKRIDPATLENFLAGADDAQAAALAETLAKVFGVTPQA